MQKTLHGIGALCGYAALAFQLAAFGAYFLAIYFGQVNTNPISWWLWPMETALGLAIYVDRTGDSPKWLSEAGAFFGVCAVAIYLAVRVALGDATIVLAPVEPIDIFAVVASVAIFIFWLLTRKKIGADAALWLFQIVLLADVFPILRATYIDPSIEPLLAWELWTVCFSLQSLAAMFRWDGLTPLLSPLGYAGTHGAVVCMIIWHGAAL